MALWCLTHCMTETLPARLQSRAREGSRVANTRELSWGAQAQGHCPGATVLVHTCELGSASAGLAQAWPQTRAHVGVGVPERCPRAKHQHTMGLSCALCLSSVIWVCFRHLGGFWTMEICYLLPGLLFHFHLLNAGQSADTTLKMRGWILLLLSQGGKCPVLKQGQPGLPCFTPTRPLDFSLIQTNPHKKNP